MTHLPFVTVIMPIRNEGAFIERSLRSVLAQDYPAQRMEILIVDGYSDDNTHEKVREIQVHHSIVQLLDNPGRIVPTGLNLALQQARGEIIVRVDGHTIIEPHYIRQCVHLLQSTDADNVGGKMSAYGTNKFAQVVAVATSTPFGVGGSRFHYSDAEEWVDTVYMGAWRKEVFNRVGLFDEEMVRNQDDEWNYRLRKHGGRILLSPKIKSVYTVRSHPRTLWRQYYQYGFYKVRVMQKHPRQMRPRQFIPFLFVLALLIGLLATLLLSGGWVVLSSVAAAYLLANLLASFWTAFRQGWQHAPLLPLTFAILHFSYGMGFAAGLIHFWNRWGDQETGVYAQSSQ